MNNCSVSVVITTRNEGKHLENCIRSVKNQAYPQDKLEIIVVDNNSSDQTKKIAERYTDRVFNYGPERSAQRNFGVRQSKGQYILYLDADMALSVNLIKECVEKCEKNGFVALYIPERITGKGFWIRVRDFERSFYNATAIDCVRFVTRDKFLSIGGFDEDLTGPEDWDFDRRIRQLGKVGIIDSPLYHKEDIFNLMRYLNKKIYYSEGIDRYIRKWGKEDVEVKKQIGLLYRYFGVFIENNKAKRLTRHPVYTCSMCFLRLCVGTVFLTNKLYRRLCII